MAVNSKDPVTQKIYNYRHFFDKEVRCLSKREVRWVQSYLSRKYITGFYNLGSNSPHKELIRQLAEQDNFQELFYDAYNTMQHNILPEENFEWIKNDIRIQIFILEILSNENNHIFNTSPINSVIHEIYIFFDYNNNSSLANRIILNNIKNRWFAIKSIDKYSKWLKEDNNEQISWVGNYLLEKELLIKSTYNFTSIKEERAKILASLDLIYIDTLQEVFGKYSVSEETASKTIIIDKMKRAWSQQKYRDAGKTKKPYHLPLTKKTKARLEKMAQVQGLSETAMLDILINRFYELDYVDVDGKDLY